MKTQDILLVGGLGLVAYMMLKPKTTYLPTTSYGTPVYQSGSSYLNNGNSTSSIITSVGQGAGGVADLVSSLGDLFNSN